jgi:hypothetical protein
LTPRARGAHNPPVGFFRWRARERETEEPGGITLDDKLHQMLKDLRRALSDAISESSEVSRNLRRIREEGYSLYLLVDCKRESSDGESLALSPATRTAAASTSFSSAAPARSDPSFQINGRDLSFLKSIGIDPTRRLRRRRSTL